MSVLQGFFNIALGVFAIMFGVCVGITIIGLLVAPAICMWGAAKVYLGMAQIGIGTVQGARTLIKRNIT